MLNAMKNGKYYGADTVATRKGTGCCYCGREDCSKENPFYYVGSVGGSQLFACNKHASKAYMGKPQRGYFKGSKTDAKTTHDHKIKVVANDRNFAKFCGLGFGLAVKAVNRKWMLESDIQTSCHSMGHLSQFLGTSLAKFYVNLGKGWVEFHNIDEYHELTH